MRSPNPGTAIANSRKIRNLLVLHFDVRKVGWSNGQVEAQVNRLKMLKRQIYSRASHELLKKRFLYGILSLCEQLSLRTSAI